MRYLCRIVSLLAVAGLLAPAFGADEREMYRKAMEQQKKNQEQHISRLPALPGDRRRLDQIFTIVVQEGRLTLKSPLLDPGQANMRGRQFKAEVEGFAGACTVMVHSAGAASWYFTFNNIQYPDLEGMSSVSINAQPAHLNICRNSNSRNRNYNVNLMQSFGQAMFGQPDGVTLAVYSSDTTGRMTNNFNLSEPDFATLRRKHPVEVREHLRPLLRELHLDSLLAIEPIIAWQVFADHWPANTEFSQRVRQYIPALDADAYGNREEATTALRKMGPSAALAIYLLPREGLSMEQNARLDAVAAAYSLLSRKEAQRLHTDVDFLLDCLYCEDAQIRRLAHQHLCEAVKRELPFNLDAAESERWGQIEALRKQIAGPATRPAGKSEKVKG